MAHLSENPVFESFDTATILPYDYYRRAEQLKTDASPLERKFFAQLTGQILCNRKSFEGFDVEQMAQDLAALAQDKDNMVAGEARWQFIEFIQKRGKELFAAATVVAALVDVKGPFNAKAARPRPAASRAARLEGRGFTHA